MIYDPSVDMIYFSTNKGKVGRNNPYFKEKKILGIKNKIGVKKILKWKNNYLIILLDNNQLKRVDLERCCFDEDFLFEYDYDLIDFCILTNHIAILSMDQKVLIWNE